jgi:putative spermidine/putrescine transport system substrate-binding protein
MSGASGQEDLMNRHLSVAAAAASVALAVAIQLFAIETAEARDFTVASWGGESNDALRDIFTKPFTDATGINVLLATYDGGWGQFKAMEGSGEKIWDLATVEPAEMQRGCEDGLFVKLDWSRIGPNDKFLPGVVDACGMGQLYSAQTVGYNDKLIGPKKPTRIEDFFDVKTWPGKRGILDRPKPTLEWALLADGVAPQDVFKVLSTPEGVDRAFAKLDTIKPYLIYWTKGAQPPELLANGDVVISQVFSGRIVNAHKEGKPLAQIWDRAIIYLDRWVMIAGTGHEDDAYKFLKFYANPNLQAQYAITKLPYGPISVGAAELIPPDVAAGLPAGNNIKNAYFTGSAADISFWTDHNDELTERWNKWKSRN